MAFLGISRAPLLNHRLLTPIQQYRCDVYILIWWSQGARGSFVRLRKVLLPRLVNYMIFVLGSANPPSPGGSTLLGVGGDGAAWSQPG